MEEIIEGCREGDAASQRLLFELAKDRIFGIAFRYMKNEELAKDMVQDSFIKMFKHLPSLKKASLFNAWSSQITVRTCLDEIRKRMPQMESLSTSLDEQAVSGGNMEEEIFRKLELEQIVNTLKQLPEGYQLVFNLYMIDGFSHKEISLELGISESTSRSQLTKARAKMVHLLQIANRIPS